MKVYDSLIRVSRMNGREESADSTMTIKQQEGANAKAISDAGGRVGKVLKATDQSGYSVHKSKAWQLAVARIQRGESNGIVVAYDDRLMRNWRKAGPFYDALEDAGGEVIIAGMPNVDYRTPHGRTMTGLMAVMSDAGYQAAKTRGDNIKDETLRRGVPNRVSFGYRRNGTWVDDQLVGKVDPERDAKALVPDDPPEDPDEREERIYTAPIVRLIFKMRADGYPWVQIADRLDELGVPSAGGNPRWTTSTLNHIVENEAYLGTIVFGRIKRDRSAGKDVRRIEDAHEPLVSATLWRAAQSTLTISRNGRLIGGLATGSLVCSGCGLTLSVVSSRDHRGELRPNYGCRRTSSAGKCPRPVYVRKDRVDPWLDAQMVLLIEGGEFGGFVSAREVEALRATWKAEEAELAAFQLHARATDPGYGAGLQMRRDNVERARHAYEDAAARQEGDTRMPVSAKMWRNTPVDGQRRVVRSVIDRIIVAPPASHSKFEPLARRLDVIWRDGVQPPRAAG